VSCSVESWIVTSVLVMFFDVILHFNYIVLIYLFALSLTKLDVGLPLFGNDFLFENQ
jgi:hypothetical protein